MQPFISQQAYLNERLQGLNNRLEKVIETLAGPSPSDPVGLSGERPRPSGSFARLEAEQAQTLAYIDWLQASVNKLENFFVDEKSPSPDTVSYIGETARAYR